MNYETAFYLACFGLFILGLVILVTIQLMRGANQEREWMYGQLIKTKYGHLPYNRGLASTELENQYTLVRKTR